ncbi:DUF1631 family protein [Pelomonas sp. SE-A7]|uniref:DUF1631 family protein n=1 Tax=Pelomonas sp. SE-A7 TaxID=3054953 RepID=UPI00259CF2C6|nr:DUF1631 family protein [Pelomonas sp. SE-A7]MDM4766747.1 DUF1631 family protein [Pelomonas sp. SE-A7]
MTDPARSTALVAHARRVYLEALLRGVPALVHSLSEAGRQLLLMAAEYPVQMARKDAVGAWIKLGPLWQSTFMQSIRQAAAAGGTFEIHAETGEPSRLTLVEDRIIEREITSSRLALAIMDRASWEFTDLRTRINTLEQHEELPSHDLLRAPVLAGLVLHTWQNSGLGPSEWQMFQGVLHDEFAHLVSEAYHEVNHWLVERKVMPEVDLRPFIKRSPQARQGALMAALAGGTVVVGAAVTTQAGAVTDGAGPISEATRFMARPVATDQAALSPYSAQAAEVLAQLQRIVGKQIPAFAATIVGGEVEHHDPVPPSPRLSAAINRAQDALVRRPEQARRSGKTVTGAPLAEPPAPQVLDELKVRNQAFKQVLKQAADSPAERATIEIVAMMFQSILTEERIPAAVRVWFARLQMPVLRVAVSEPEFFAEADHPARRLIDRMGACVMGFSSSTGSESLEREIKRIVQVVEAYPDTGRRVFQTVLTEFEKFLEQYFEKENQASAKGVSLAQQVEQRETMAIQYTIELRKMLNEVPVQDGIRQFLFQVWADVLAVTAVRSGAQADVTRQMKRAAADLIWSASAKVSREERAEVIRRLPPLLKTLRDGMGHAGLSAEKQDEHIRSLNNSLAAAFTAKAAAIPRERLDDLMDQLETLEAMLPEAEGVEINDTLMRDLSGHETEGLEVVAEGGSAPTPAMLAWAKELQVGGWYMLDYRGRNEAVQLAWRGNRRNMVLFVSPNGRGVLFQQARLASFLQAGLLLPAQDEALTVKATRNALAKLDVDPSRLLN